MAAIGAVAACLGALVPTAAAQTATGMPPRPQQLGSYWITYYWFVPESAFTGARNVPKGLTTAYREDFLYSARGIAARVRAPRAQPCLPVPGIRPILP
ncbi:MAG: hypothetical protein ACKOSO_00875, partial [Actinomycetota bacterium]